MLEFYEFNTFNICVVLISTFLIYYILSNYFNISKEKDDNNDNFNLEYLIISLILALIISLIVSYVMTSSDEEILKDNYWDNSQLE